MISNDIRQKLLLHTREKKEWEKQLYDPMVCSDPEKVRILSQKIAETRDLCEAFAKFQKWERVFSDAEEMKTDPEMADLAEEEMLLATEQLKKIEALLKKLLIPKDPFDSKDAIIEVRPGAGGDEAGLFAAELVRAYLRFAEKQNFTIDIVSKNENDSGGMKEFIAEIKGQNAFSFFKFEGGVHRVQRIPKTESQGRVHTSAVSVVTMPLIPEKDFVIDDADLRFDTFRASGPGGQSVNTTDSAVRVTHIPTGIIASCQDQKSQLKNKMKALGVLRSRLAAADAEKKATELGEKRLAQIGSGDRSDKIRTYNFPQDRVTDHRLTGSKKSFSNLPEILLGHFDGIVETLKEEEAILKSGGGRS